jgi:Holliday junction resolvase
VSLTNRQRGDYFERQVVLTMRAHGWVVVRSAGSLGVADLVALRKGNTPTLVSCKLGGRIDPAERTAILDAADIAGARAVVAMRPKGGRVLIAAVMRGTSRLVPLDTLRVPARPGKERAS